MKRKIVNDWYQVTNSFSEPEILMYGYIGPYDDIDFASFQLAVREIAKTHKSVTVRLNSGGGSVIEGLSIYDCLIASGLYITIIIEGMAASMGGVIAQAGHRRKMNRNAFIMIHRVKGCEHGDADDLRAYADLVEQCEGRVKKIFVDNTGQTAETVDGWFAKKVDWWISPDEAQSLGLIDEIIDIDGAEPIQRDLSTMEEQEAYNLISNSIKNQNTQIQMDKMKIAILAVLAGRGITNVTNGTDEQIAAAITGEFTRLDTKVTELKNKLTEKDNQRVDDFVNAGKESGQIKDEDAEDWKELAGANYDLAVKQLAKIPVTPKNVTIEVGLKREQKGSQTRVSATQPANATWTYGDWEKQDRKGLMKMKSEQPENYARLWEEFYGQPYAV